MSAATVTTKELAALLGVSDWALYESVRRGDCPVPVIKVGKRIVFSKAAVDRVLGVTPERNEDGPTSAIDDVVVDP